MPTARSADDALSGACPEMLLDEPLCCPLYGALTFDGLGDRQ